MTVVLWDINVKKRRQNDNTPSENRATNWTLDDYYKVAKRCIGAFATGSLAKSMMQDEDALSFVAEHLMIGAHRWDETRGRSLHSYLNQCAIWCIKRWVKIHRTNPHGAVTSLNDEAFTDSRVQMYEITADDKSVMPDDDIYSQENSIELASLIDKAGLTERQLHCIEVVYIKGQRPTEVARDLGISRQAVDQCLTKGIRKLRGAIDGQEETLLR